MVRSNEYEKQMDTSAHTSLYVRTSYYDTVAHASCGADGGLA